jgi:hypothetical protein
MLSLRTGGRKRCATTVGARQVPNTEARSTPQFGGDFISKTEEVARFGLASHGIVQALGARRTSSSAHEREARTTRV